MLLKTTKFSLIFFTILLINVYISVKAYRYSLKNTKILVILEEIRTLESIKTPSSVLGVSSDSLNSDIRVATLKSFFRQHNSPLYDHADFIVASADKYNLDFKLVPAISMQESNACRVIPNNSYNCWGWGIYGANVTRFSSYEEAIETVSKGLKENYIDRGLISADEIMRKYTPGSNGSWAFGVETFLKILE